MKWCWLMMMGWMIRSFEGEGWIGFYGKGKKNS